MLLSDSGMTVRIRLLAVLPGKDRKPGPFSERSFEESDTQVSPDGRWVADTSDESGKSQVYARSFPGPGGKTSISIEGGQEARWSRDRRELFYRAAGRNRLMVVDIRPA